MRGRERDDFRFFLVVSDFRETRRYHDDERNSFAAARLDYAAHRWSGNDDDCDVDFAWFARRVFDAGKRFEPQDFFFVGVNRVNASFEAARDDVLEDAVTDFFLVGGSADYGYASRFEQALDVRDCRQINLTGNAAGK